MREKKETAGKTTVGKMTGRKKTTGRKKRAGKKKKGVKLPVARIAKVLGLMLLLAFSMGAVGYVIFFRTVLV